MKVKRAIFLLKNPRLFTQASLKKEWPKALQMGIDALERLQTSRKRSRHSVHALLPGETFEEAI